MIVDIPKGLPVPIVSSLPTSILEWNSNDKNFLPMVFDIGSSLVHGNGIFLRFHKDSLKLRADIKGYSKAYHSSILKEWTGINYLPMTNARDASKTMSGSNLIICIILLDTYISYLYVAHYIPCYFLHTMLLSSVDAEVLYSTIGEELSKAAFFHLLHLA